MRMNQLPPASQLRKSPRRFPWVWMLPALCLLFFLACAAVSLKPTREAKPVATSAPITFTQLVPDGLGTPVSVSLTADGEAFVLTRTEDGYRLENEDAALSDAAARELLASGAAIIARKQLTGNPADYGMDSPSAVAVYTYENGESLTLTLGSMVPTGEGWYACIQGDDKVYVVNNSLQRTLTMGREALWALPALSDMFTANTLLNAVITQPGMETVAITRTLKENPFNTVAEITQPVRYPANAERAAEIYLALEQLQPVAMADPHGTDADWGLEQPLAVITLTDRETHTLTLGRVEDTCTLRIDQEPAVYRIDPDSTAFLTHVTVPYLAEQLPGLVALSQVETLTVEAEGEVIRAAIDAAAGSFRVDDRDVPPETFKAVCQQLIGLLIERYAGQQEQIGESRVTFTYALKSGETFTLGFHRWDDQFDLVTREGCACFLIPKSQVDSAVRTLRDIAGANGQ